MTYLYVIEAENGVFKIGVADDVAKRFCDIDRCCPVELTIRLCIEIDWHIKYGLERELRHHFGHKCRKGEWFELNEEDIEYIAGQGKPVAVSKFIETMNGVERLAFRNGATRYMVTCPNCRVKGSVRKRPEHIELRCRNCGIITTLPYPLDISDSI